MISDYTKKLYIMSDEYSNIPEDLQCPITCDLLEDPIISPCCGRAFSRSSLINCLEASDFCPICKSDISNFDVMNSPKSVNLNYMIDSFKKNALSAEHVENKINISPEWKAEIKIVPTYGVYQTVIGRLEIKNINNKFNYKTLLVPVIDKSGSMAGSPIKQVQYSLNRLLDLTYNNPNIMTTMITYDDRALSTDVNKSNPISHYANIIDRISGGGGTSFKSAFNEVIKICDKYKSDDDISSVVVIFLTDGDDSSVTINNRSQLVQLLKTDIEKVWSKPYTVHSIGFGSNHDFDFLNKLRLIGTTEGAYRFADPSEDSDSLSNKINSLLNVIAQASSIPLKLESVTQKIDVPIMGTTDKTKYWLNLTNHNKTEPFECVIIVNNKPISVIAELVDRTVDDETKLKQEWISHLIDQIASEMITLSSNNTDSTHMQIHYELLIQRSRSIFIHLESSNPDSDRLAKLMELINTMKTGGSVNQQKLTDMKFEGIFSTKKSGDPLKQGLAYRPSDYDPNAVAQPSRTFFANKWETIPIKRRGRYFATSDCPEIFSVIARYKNCDAIDWINRQSDFDEKDRNGSNVLIAAASIGRANIVKALLDTRKIQINDTNNEGYTALDVAVLQGYWITFDILVEFGERFSPNQPTKTSIEGSLLLRTCISNRYFNMCQRLIRHKIAIITGDMMDCVPTTEGLKWLSTNTQKNISYEAAILKGMYDTVKEQLNSISTISWKPYLDIFIKPTLDHLGIVDLLLSNGKADANEIMDIIRDGENEKTWPLFMTCEKGDLSMFKVLMKYVSKNMINMQNNKGTTVLWIACCNKHIDIVGELLNNGADPNICNFKGDSPLIPCCQKGSTTLIELLLESGVRMDSYNKNRDNPILICCRTGQADILEILLKRLSKNDQLTLLNTAAEIDGFVPLLASTELDKTKCIRICVNFGADIEARSAYDNQIIAGATAMHLACFYGRVSSVRTLHELGAKIASQTTVHGYTSLHIAIRQSQSNVVRYLLTLEEGRACLKIPDYDGRLPSYYAHMTGNEDILEEFFTNKLSLLMEKSLLVDKDMEKKCADVLVNYGRSPGYFEYSDITNLDISKGSTLLTLAILNSNQHLAFALETMGASFNKPDDYGVSPAFWAAFFGNCINPSADANTISMLDRVKNVAKKNVQNKLLTSLQPNIPLLLEDKACPKGQINSPLCEQNKQNLIGPMTKMNDGYALTVKDNVLSALRNSGLVEHSLLGFMEKLKNNKIFPDGKECLEYIIWDAKVHLIKVLAKEEQKLQPIHIMALYLYTSNLTLFQQVNKTLTNWNNTSIWHPYIGCLYQAIELLPKYINEVYRAVDIKFNAEDYKIGGMIKWSTFSICSKEFANTTELLNKKRGIIFIIKSLTGRLISKYSKTPADSEVIFLPESEFEITNHYVASLICLGQANIRTSTFSAKEKDLQKAMNEESCIIIELQEVGKNI